MTALLLLHAAATCFMAGLIWFVQIVHYPLMGRVGGAEWTSYEAAHMRRTTWVVGPVMLVEVACAVSIVLWPAAGDGEAHRDGAAGESIARLGWMGLGLLLVIWLSTALVQVPCHARLARGFDPAAHRRLVGSNRIRTAAWSARVVVAVVMVGLV